MIMIHQIYGAHKGSVLCSDSVGCWRRLESVDWRQRVEGWRLRWSVRYEGWRVIEGVVGVERFVLNLVLDRELVKGDVEVKG